MEIFRLDAYTGIYNQIGQIKEKPAYSNLNRITRCFYPLPELLVIVVLKFE